jgi:hypothetical protein
VDPSVASGIYDAGVDVRITLYSGARRAGITELSGEEMIYDYQHKQNDFKG